SNKLAKRTRDWIDIFGHVFFLFPFVALLLWLCIPYFINSYNSGEVSSNAGGLLIWPAKGLILLGFASLFFQWMSELIKRIAIMRGRLADQEPGGHSPEAEAERLLNELGTANAPGRGTPPGDGIS